ncbi:hypothetical protein AB0C74_31245 [Spirillospora sp. NPDC048832]|jgi:hypothetical protein
MNLAGYEWKSDFAKKHRAEGFAKGYAEGFAKGYAEGLLAVLEARGIAVSDEARQLVSSCRDTDRLEGWLRRAGLVHKVEDLFD